MMDHKGQTDVENINPENYDVGDCLSLEVGDWNGSGFAYKQNSNATIRVYVAKVSDDKLVVVPKDEAVDYRMTGDSKHETTIKSDGFTNLTGMASWNDRVKSLKVKQGLSGKHKVAPGLDKD